MCLAVLTTGPDQEPAMENSAPETFPAAPDPSASETFPDASDPSPQAISPGDSLTSSPGTPSSEVMQPTTPTFPSPDDMSEPSHHLALAVEKAAYSPRVQPPAMADDPTDTGTVSVKANFESEALFFRSHADDLETQLMALHAKYKKVSTQLEAKTREAEMLQSQLDSILDSNADDTNRGESFHAKVQEALALRSTKDELEKQRRLTSQWEGRASALESRLNATLSKESQERGREMDLEIARLDKARAEKLKLEKRTLRTAEWEPTVTALGGNVDVMRASLLQAQLDAKTAEAATLESKLDRARVMLLEWVSSIDDRIPYWLEENQDAINQAEVGAEVAKLRQADFTCFSETMVNFRNSLDRLGTTLTTRADATRAEDINQGNENDEQNGRKGKQRSEEVGRSE
jgi:hypothetical protein